MKMRKKISDSRGFSFGELMVVIGIIGILSAIAFPAFLSRLPDMRLRAGVRAVYADLQRVKLEAINRNSCMSVDFTTGGGYEAFFDDNCDKNQDTGELTFLAVSSTPGGVDSLPGGVSISYISPTINPVCYNPQGMICGSQTGYIKLTNNNSLWGRVRIRPAGGLQIEMSHDDNNWY